jgi:hypothetical protein
VFKQPLLALFPRRIAACAANWMTPGLPAVRWTRVIACLLTGIATHLAWDALTHRGHFAFVEAVLFPGIPAYRALQHASTLLGTAILAGWFWRKLRAVPLRADVPQAPRALRVAAVAAMLILPAAALLLALDTVEGTDWRTWLRAAAVIAVSTLGLVALSFCLAWRLSPRLRARPRPPARACATARPR